MMRQTRQVLIPGTDAINIQDGSEIKALAVSYFNPNLESAIEFRRYFIYGTQSTRRYDI
jgi:hypothetical protein